MFCTEPLGKVDNSSLSNLRAGSEASSPRGSPEKYSSTIFPSDTFSAKGFRKLSDQCFELMSADQKLWTSKRSLVTKIM